MNLKIFDAYKKLSDAMLPAMKKFNTSVKVGGFAEPIYNDKGAFVNADVWDVYLLVNGEFG